MSEETYAYSAFFVLAGFVTEGLRYEIPTMQNLNVFCAHEGSGMPENVLGKFANSWRTHLFFGGEGGGVM